MFYEVLVFQIKFTQSYLLNKIINNFCFLLYFKPTSTVKFTLQTGLKPGNRNKEKGNGTGLA